MQKIHTFVSVILSPILIAFYLVVFLSLFSPVGLGSMGTMASVIAGTVFLVAIPAATVFFTSNSLTGWNFYSKEKRTRPYILSIASYLAGSAVFLYFGNQIMFFASFTYFMVTLFMMLVNFRCKISIHVAGVAGPVTALVYLFGSRFALLYLLVLPVAYSRYRLKSHSSFQLVLGAVVAVFITGLTYVLVW